MDFPPAMIHLNYILNSNVQTLGKCLTRIARLRSIMKSSFVSILRNLIANTRFVRETGYEPLAIFCRHSCECQTLISACAQERKCKRTLSYARLKRSPMRSYFLAILAVDLVTFCWTTVGYEKDANRIFALDSGGGTIVIARRNFLELYHNTVNESGMLTKQSTRRIEWAEGAFIASGTALLDFKLLNATLIYFCSTSSCAYVHRYFFIF